MKSMVKLADSNEIDSENDKSGFLLYNNKTVCIEGFKISASNAMCRLLGYSNSRKWIAREKEDHEVHLGALFCDGLEGNTCSFQDRAECRASNVVFLYCTGFYKYNNQVSSYFFDMLNIFPFLGSRAHNFFI